MLFLRSSNIDRASTHRVTLLRLAAGPLLANSYVICDDGECVLVDPSGDAETIMRSLRGRDLRLVVATHLHFDHVWGAKPLVEASGAEFLVHRSDWELRRQLLALAEDLGFRAPELPDRVRFVEDGQVIWGDLEVLHTPGHTPGSITLVGDGFVLTGDLLFRGSVGRADLPGSNLKLLISSICKIYRKIPHHYVVYPGHGPPTVVGAEAAHNPFVDASSCASLNPGAPRGSSHAA